VKRRQGRTPTVPWGAIHSHPVPACLAGPRNSIAFCGCFEASRSPLHAWDVGAYHQLAELQPAQMLAELLCGDAPLAG
jgi:hypothetical protein